MKTLIALLLILAAQPALGQTSLTTPGLLHPEDNGFSWTSADFSWTPSPGATSYQFQISRDSTLFQDIAVDTIVSTASFADDIWEPDGWYHWRVRALSVSDSSDWSEVRRFLLRFPVNTEQTQPSQTWLSISPCYPNPVRDQITLEFESARPGEVEIKVFNLLGQRVMSYKTATLEAGKHGVRFGDMSLPPGLYAGRISDGVEARSFTFTVAR